MRALPASVLFVLAALASVNACTSAFGEAPSDVLAPAREGGVGDAGGIDAPAPDGATAVEAGVLTQPQIGTGCVNRTPPWLECRDFETGETGSAFFTNGGSLSVVAGGEGNVLRASVPPLGGGIAYLQVAVAAKAKRVVWSFDVRIDPKVVDSSELAELDLPMASGDTCSIFIGRRDGKLRFLESCRVGGIGVEDVITQLGLPPSPDGWFNVFVDASFDERKISGFLRWPDGQTTTGSGNLKRAVVDSNAKLQVGIAFAPQSSVVDIDNVVAWSN